MTDRALVARLKSDGWSLVETTGFIHLIGSDGHGIDRRLPELKAGYERLAKWAGRSQADRIACEWGAAVLRGKPLKVPPPRPGGRSWFSRLLGG